jgi:hypothetical protein
VALVGWSASQRIDRIGEGLRSIVAVTDEVNQQGRPPHPAAAAGGSREELPPRRRPQVHRAPQEAPSENDALIKSELGRAQAENDTAKAAKLTALAETYQEYNGSFDEVVEMANAQKTDAAIYHSVWRSSPKAERMLAVSDELHEQHAARVLDEANRAAPRSGTRTSSC